MPINRSLSFIFVFGHTPLSNTRLCEYLNIKDCSPYCQQAKIPTVEKIQAVISDLLELQVVSYSIRVTVNIIEITVSFGSHTPIISTI
jgi:hypothetical protein